MQSMQQKINTQKSKTDETKGWFAKNIRKIEKHIVRLITNCQYTLKG